MIESPLDIEVVKVTRVKGFLPQLVKALDGDRCINTAHREQLKGYDTVYTEVYQFGRVQLNMYHVRQHLRKGKFSFEKETIGFRANRRSNIQKFIREIKDMVREGMTLEDIRGFYEL